MLEVAELSTAEKRNRIEVELFDNPNRSDREIGRVVGVDHKTVGAARERLGIASPLGNSQPELSPREQLLRKTLPSDIDPDSPAFQADLAKIDRIADAEAAREVLGMNDEEDHFEPGNDAIAVPGQPALAVYRNRYGSLVIRQEAAYPNDDPAIYVRPENVEMLIAKLRAVAAEASK